MDYLTGCLKDLQYLVVVHQDESSVSYYHPKGAYLVVARVARARAEEDFQKRAGEQWKKNQEAIRRHRDYNLNNFVITT